MKERAVKVIKRILVQILYIIVFLTFSILCAILISHKFEIILRTVMVYVGFLIALVGALLSPRGSRSIINMNAFGQRSAEQIVHQELEINRLEQELERKDTFYHRKFFQLVKEGPHNITFVITGGILLFYAIKFL